MEPYFRKGRNDTGWKDATTPVYPTVSVEFGVREMIQWCKQRRQKYLKQANELEDMGKRASAKMARRLAAEMLMMQVKLKGIIPKRASIEPR